MEDPDLAAGEECKARGNTHFKKGEFELAAEAYGEAIRCSPDRCVFWLNRSNAYRQLLKWANAETDAAEALRLDPTNAKAHYARAICLQRLGLLQKALAACETGLCQHPDNKALQQVQNDLVKAQKEKEEGENDLVNVKKETEEGEEVAMNKREVRSKAEVWDREAARTSALARRSTQSSSTSSSSSSDDEGVNSAAGKKKKQESRAIRDDELPCLRLSEAAEDGDAAECKKLLDSGTVQDINWKRPEDGNTALHVASEESHLNVVSVLLARGANVEVTNDFLLRPFELATPGCATEKLLAGVTKPLGEDRRNALPRA